LTPLFGAGCKYSLGEEHPATLNARGSLAQTLSQLGEADAARAEYEAVIAGSTAGMGEDDARTLGYVFKLAVLKKEQLGEVEGGLILLRRCVELAHLNPSLGKYHRDTKRYKRALAEWEVSGKQFGF